MPVKLSGELVEEARSSARVFHRSLTAQIEHWASLGRAVEARLPGETVGQLLRRPASDAMRIGDVATSEQREQVASALSECLSPSPADAAWLRQISESGIPLYGSEPGDAERILRLNPDGSQENVDVTATATESSD